MTRSFAPFLFALSLGSCTSFETTVAEFDGVTSTGPSNPGDVDEIRYSSTVDRYPWALRQIEGTGIDMLFTKLLSVQRGPAEVDDPVGFARERIRDLAEKAPTDPDGLAQAVSRLLFVAEKRDSGALNRADALQGLTTLAQHLPMRLEPPPRIARTDESYWKNAGDLVNRLHAFWPGQRPQRELSGEEKRTHVAALDATAAFAWAGPRRPLIRALRLGYVLEQDPELKEATKSALLRAMADAVGVVLWRGLDDANEMVREESLVSLVSVFGPPAVPEVLARLSRGEVGSEQVRYDPSADVRRRIVHLAGSVDLVLLQQSREGAPSVLQFLANVATGDPDPGVQMLALRTLAQKLGLPVSYDPGWAKEWWGDYVVTGRVLQAK